ncbi:hypothetical protein CK203_102731 [Vitis vinifera]|uniref:Uncharacterized protein n=1 Tax=Vitis vinifera TaxID=29760 RepID=A0A438C6H0_VITVI|nr:hypothetical protein CK203_102731 [Vitis vinifera]
MVSARFRRHSRGLRNNFATPSYLHRAAKLASTLRFPASFSQHKSGIVRRRNITLFKKAAKSLRNKRDKLPKSRCSGKKFITAIARLAPEKQQAIREMGFGGLLTFACHELRYELCGWLISQYDFTYHRLNMGTDNVVFVNEEHVSKVMGIPNSGQTWLSLRKQARPIAHTPLGNWAKFMLQYLEDGIKEYHQNQPSYIRGCLMFLQLFYMAYFYMSSVKVEVTSPLAAAWSDDVIKRRLATEISTFDGYGHVHAQEQPQSTPHMNVPLVALTSLASDYATEDVAALRSRHSGSEGNSSVHCPNTEHQAEYQPMRRTSARVVADYALAQIDDPSEILCKMYGMYITREEISYLNTGRWVNLMVKLLQIVEIMSRMLNGQQTPLAHAHYFDPSFSVHPLIS